MSSNETIPALLRKTVAERSEEPAIGIIEDGELHWKNWQQLNADLHRRVAGLRAKGVNPEDRVAHLGPNSYEWIVTDLAILWLGAVHVPLHARLSPEQAKTLIKKVDANLLVISKQSDDFFIPQATYGEIQGGSGPIDPSLDPDSLATILFTSGTTGTSRGVMLSHRNLIENCRATAEAVGAKSDETRLVVLPFSHIYARTCDLYSWLMRGSKLVLAESRETIVRDSQLARPTVINAVPYLYQKIAQALIANGKAKTPGAVQELLGSNIKRLFCGGAPVAPEVESLFEKQGLPILSGYGLTEASPVITASSLENYSPGSVGRPLSNLEVELATDGEILVRGPSVMQGYWQDDEATQDALADGWLRTGDLGEFDERRNLRIVGRKKELIVLATGKNVSPAVVEQRLIGSPLIEHVCVVGDGRKCLAALIVPNPDALRDEIRQRRLWIWSKRRAVSHPQIRSLIRAELDRLLSDLGHDHQVGPYAILPRNFSSERGEMTLKLSLCRQVIERNFSCQIERMYREISRHR